jgi:hypothetical protein
MRNKKLISYLSAFTILTLVSCEKEVHINLGTPATQLVVQGAVETGLPPYVVLTSTIGFFSQVNLGTLQNAFIHGANVQVACGNQTVTLKEYAIDTSFTNKFYIYSVDTAMPGNVMLGQVDSFYKLTITYNGQIYTSTTKIPTPKGLDSIWFGTPVYQNSKTPVNALQLYANYTDPDTPGNCVQYFTARDGAPFYPSGIFNDDLVNGKVVDDIALFAGYDNGADVNRDSIIYFYPGEAVTVKWCEIDKNVYNFWNTYQFALSDVGNPFASPINVQSNISNGALGVWAGYGSISYKLTVPH